MKEYEENNLRHATGFELATLHKKLWQEANDGDFSQEALKELSKLSQTIALGDTHEDQFVFVANNFWDYMLCLIERIAATFQDCSSETCPRIIAGA